MIPIALYIPGCNKCVPLLMGSLLTRARRLFGEEGGVVLIKRGFQYGYEKYLRKLLPRRTVSYNDIPVRASRIGDSVIPWHTTDIPGYEGALVRGIRKYVENGDTVNVVGGGWGVSTVAAAKQAGEHGRVITYEGGKETVEKVEETVQLNGVGNRVTVRHAVVGNSLSLRGDGTHAKAVSPIELPDCDVLVLDCEGAEMEILEEMEIRPRAIVVETHGMFGATKTDVQNKLTSAGYDTVESTVAEERLRETCEENGIYVLFSTVRN